MAKKVRYNGGNMSYYSCSDPKALKVGKVYEVMLERDRGWQTDYTLKGVEGEYNSVWFDRVNNADERLYMAIAHEIPEIGSKYTCYKMEFVDGKVHFKEWHTSTVKAIKYMGNNVYHVTTKNSVYIVNVG